MKISLNWLKRYVDIDVPTEELCDKMVMAGFEVESIENLADSIKNVVAAKILKIEKHPDSDHLLICQMDTGNGEALQIITGAQNVFEGAIVPAALHDSLLPDGTHIKKGKLRGLESNGMLCSGDELGLTEADYPGAEVNGILILKDDVTVGADIRDVLGLNDVIIDFKITANRPDCQCVLGVAREVGVVLGKTFNAPSLSYKTSGGNIKDMIDIEVLDYDLCPRYMGRCVSNLRIKESPDWMKQALRAAGMRPINNIVDITNFVMLETGQPMHAFDRRDIKGDKIIVRRANDGDTFVTLDTKEHTLDSSMLVIADAEAPSCLAGVMGGLDSEIKNDTAELFLESAKFRRDNIRKTCRTLGLRTEASSRYERGTDIMNVEYAMERALSLIYELDAGDIIDGVIDRNAGLPQPRHLSVESKKIGELLGVSIPEEKMVEILNSLHITTTCENGVLECDIPSFRDDIEGRADIAEEVMRIYGYDYIVGTKMNGPVLRGTILPERKNNNEVKSVMSAAGAREITTYSFISSKALEPLNLSEDDERNNAIRLINPLGDEYSTLRTQLTTSMLTVLGTNYNRKNKNVRLYEISKRFIAKSFPLTEQPDEIPTMSVGAYGENEDFFTMKGMVESILSRFCSHHKIERSAEPFLHPGRQAVIKAGNGDILAVFGEVHPSTAAAFGIGDRAYVAEVYLDKLYASKKRAVTYKPLPKFPAVTRDYAVLCNSETAVGTLFDSIRKSAGRLCESVELFDVYEGAQIPEGKKSVAFSVTLRSADSTLTDAETEAVTERIIKGLEAAGAELRK